MLQAVILVQPMAEQSVRVAGSGQLGISRRRLRLSWVCPKGAQERSLGTVFTQGLGMVRMGFSG